MHALNTTHRLPVSDRLQPLVSARARAAVTRLEGVAGPAGWLVGAVIATIVLRLAGAAGEPAIAAIAGTASLVYLGTAMVSGRPGVAILDVATAMLAAGLAVTGAAAPATIMMVHVLWGALRTSVAGSAPGRKFAAGWSIFFGAQALLLSLSA